jgi:hypothetical protein
MAASLAGAGVSEHLARHHCQAERVIEFVICEQSGIRRDHRSTKLERQFVVEIEPENAIGLFTRRVLHDGVTPPIYFYAGRDVVEVLTKCWTQNLWRGEVRLLAREMKQLDCDGLGKSPISGLLVKPVASLHCKHNPIGGYPHVHCAAVNNRSHDNGSGCFSPRAHNSSGHVSLRKLRPSLRDLSGVHPGSRSVRRLDGLPATRLAEPVRREKAGVGRDVAAGPTGSA